MLQTMVNEFLNRPLPPESGKGVRSFELFVLPDVVMLLQLPKALAKYIENALGYIINTYEYVVTLKYPSLSRNT